MHAKYNSKKEYPPSIRFIFCDMKQNWSEEMLFTLIKAHRRNGDATVIELSFPMCENWIWTFFCEGQSIWTLSTIVYELLSWKSSFLISRLIPDASG